MVSVQDHLTILLILCMASSALGATTIFNVMSYGAVGNGRADDSEAFLKAWKAACQGQAKSSTPVVYVPPERTFFLNPLTFNGPCKSSRIYMLVSGNIVAPVKTAWRGNQINAWIIFYGVIDGQGSSWWPDKPCFNDPANGQYCKGPTGMIFRRCNGLRLDGFSKINGPGSHILIAATNDAIVSNLRVIARGIALILMELTFLAQQGYKSEILSLQQVPNILHVINSDDCIAISAGSSNIDITGITCGPGHGISIGSLGSGGFDVVENVRVRNCTLTETLTGVRIKTLQGGKGYARKISFEGIKFVAVDNPIQIEQFYCPLKVNCQNYTSAVAISDVSFTAISGTSVASNVISLSCSQTTGCTNIKLDRVYITSSTPGKKVYANCFNAHGKATHTKPAVKCLLP
ncbi:hypothetical protein Pfo_011994 [Paulownia fortunei]|nr:hypothetical protein Pfo_011994 [Paulownia fortunei]